MPTRPLVDVVGQPDPTGLQVRHRRREVRATCQPVDLLPTHTEHSGDLRDTCESEIHSPRLGITDFRTHKMGDVRNLLPDHGKMGSRTC